MQIIVERLQPTKNGRLLIVPNLNRSSVRLPQQASRPDTPIKLDFERDNRRLDDREVVRVFIDATNAEVEATPGLSLDIVFDSMLFTLLDQSLRPMKEVEPGRVHLDLKQQKRTGTKTKDGVLVHLEARTFVGSPRLAEKAARNVVFRFVDGQGQVLLEQSTFGGAELRSADFVFLGDDASPERLFISAVGDNGPSLDEVEAACAIAGVPVTRVPLEVNFGDSWLQDQFQIGFTATREQTQLVIVHLPRVAHDSAIVPGTPNLRTFVDTFFPSEEIGLFKDCWAKILKVTDGQNEFEATVGESYAIYKAFSRIYKLLARVRRLVRTLFPSVELRKIENGNDLYLVRMEIDVGMRMLLVARNVNKEQAEEIASLPHVIDVVCAGVRPKGEEVSLILTGAKGTKTLVFDSRQAATLAEFVRELNAVHSSHNYGGNIEVSPPTTDAPHGRILVGSLPQGDVATLVKSRKSLQPLSTANTDWLEVGHVDEIAAFLPSASAGFAIARAAPQLATALLSRAAAAATAGRPVTRLFRGRKWIHQGDGMHDPHRPPRAYTRMVGPHSPYDLVALKKMRVDRSSSSRYGHASFHDDRQFLLFSQRAAPDARYAAFITCADLLELTRISNRAIDSLFLIADDYRVADDLTLVDFYEYTGTKHYREEVLPQKLDKTLARDFAGVPIVQIPVLFDRLEDVWMQGAKAIVPAAVNLQTLGKNLLIARQHGPRMHVKDALALFSDWPAAEGGLPTKPDVAFIRARGLDRTFHWTRSQESVTRAAFGTTPTAFDKDYDEYREANERAARFDTFVSPKASTYDVQHANDPVTNHPINEPETLRRIAHYFRDGFPEFVNPPMDYCKGDTEAAHPRQDKYEADIAKVEDRIRRANPNVFDKEGAVVSKDWVKIEIPEGTVDLFELYVELALAPHGVRVHWIEAWHYHVHSGGIHCGTNVLRRR